MVGNHGSGVVWLLLFRWRATVRFEGWGLLSGNSELQAGRGILSSPFFWTHHPVKQATSYLLFFFFFDDPSFIEPQRPRCSEKLIFEGSRATLWPKPAHWPAEYKEISRKIGKNPIFANILTITLKKGVKFLPTDYRSLMSYSVSLITENIGEISPIKIDISITVEEKHPNKGSQDVGNLLALQPKYIEEHYYTS